MLETKIDWTATIADLEDMLARSDSGEGIGFPDASGKRRIYTPEERTEAVASIAHFRAEQARPPAEIAEDDPS